MMTSCSPGWIKFVEQFYPDLIPQPLDLQEPAADAGRGHQELLRRSASGSTRRSIFSVAIMPCTAKKFEAGRPEMGRDGRPDIDAVLTTRELAALIRMRGLDLAALAPEAPDTPVRRADHRRQAVRRDAAA